MKSRLLPPQWVALKNFIWGKVDSRQSQDCQLHDNDHNDDGDGNDDDDHNDEYADDDGDDDNDGDLEGRFVNCFNELKKPAGSDIVSLIIQVQLKINSHIFERTYQIY